MENDFDLENEELFEKISEGFNDDFDSLVDDLDNKGNQQQKKQIISMVKKLHLAATDILKLLNHYKKILNSGHAIPDDICKQLSSMANQLIKTSDNLQKKAGNLVSNLDTQIEATQKLIDHADEILKENQN